MLLACALVLLFSNRLDWCMRGNVYQAAFSMETCCQLNLLPLEASCLLQQLVLGNLSMSLKDIAHYNRTVRPQFESALTSW